MLVNSIQKWPFTNYFQCLTKDELDLLFYNEKQIVVRKNSPVFDQRAKPKGLYIIRSGTIKIYKQGLYNKDQIFEFLKNGSVFGCEFVLTDEVTNLTAEAIEHTKLIFIPTFVVRSLFQKNECFRKQMLLTICGQLEDSQSAMLNLTQKKHKERVLDELNSLRNKFGVDDEGLIDISLKRRELAFRVGSTIEATTRTISDLKKQNIIKIKGKRIGFGKFID